MIHLGMLVLALMVAYGLRWALLQGSGSTWTERWHRSLRALVLPPLLLLGTVIAVLIMGPAGEMAGMQSGWVSYGLAWLVLGVSASVGGNLIWRGWQSVQVARACPIEWIGHQPSHILDTSVPFAAQIGFWQPYLVMSRGLRQALSEDHLQAVLIHEQAHLHYRDTFFFFGLGWIRALTGWLPYTEALWEELLTLRELRADCWASQRIDPLLLAEALLQVVAVEQDPFGDPIWSAGVFSSSSPHQTAVDRLEERVQALLGESTDRSFCTAPLLPMHWLILTLLPLMAIPFHN